MPKNDFEHIICDNFSIKPDEIQYLNFKSIKCFIEDIVARATISKIKISENEMNILIEHLQNLFLCKFNKYDVSHYSYKPNHAKINSVYKPYIIYYFCKTLHICNSIIFEMWQFKKKDIDCGIRVWTLIRNPHNCATIFIHGIGIGLVPYTMFIHKLKNKLDNIILVEIPNISCNTFYYKPVHINSMVISLKKYTECIYIKKVNIIAHSFGTFIAAAYINIYPNDVDKKILIDPMCFMRILIAIQKKSNYVCKHLTDCSKNITVLSDYKSKVLFCATSDMIFIKDFWTQFYTKKMMSCDTSLIWNIDNINNLHVIVSLHDPYFDSNVLINELEELGIDYKVFDCAHGGFVTDSSCAIIQEKIIGLILN